MKKGILKRISAIVLAFVMVAGTFGYAGSESKAADTYTGILTLNKAEGTASATNLYFKGSDTMTVTGETGDERWTYNYLTPAAGDDNGVFINGTKTDKKFLKYNYDPCYYYFTFDAMEDGGTITIKGTFDLNGQTITFREMTYTYDADTNSWTESMPADESVQMTFASGGNGGVGFYTLATDSMPVVSWTEPVYPILDGNSGVWVNGTWYNCPVKRYEEDKYYVGLIDAGYTAVAGDEIIFKGKYTYGGYIVEFSEVQASFDGTNWIAEKPVKEINLTLAGAEVDKGGKAPNAFYAAGSDDSTVIGWPANSYTALDEESGFWVDGNRYAGGIKKYAEGKYYIENFGTVAPGQTVTIKGTFRSPSSDMDIYVNEVSFTYRGWKWTQDLPEVPYTDMKSIKLDTCNAGADGNGIPYWDVYFIMDSVLPGTAWETTYDEWMLFHNETAMEVLLKPTGANGGKALNVFFYDEWLPAQKQVGDTLTLKAGKSHAFSTSTGAALENGVNLTEDFVLVWDGSTWVQQIDYTDITFTGINVNTDAKDGAWHIYLTLDGILPGEAWGVVNDMPEDFGVTVEFDGVPAKTITKELDDSTAFFEVPYSVMAKEGSHTMTVKAGYYASNVQGIGLHVTEDFTVYINEAGFTTTADAYVADVNATLNAESDNSKTPNGFIIMTDKEDGVAVDGAEWTSRIYPAFEKNVSESGQILWYAGANGVTVNGEYKAVNIPLVKVGNGEYYVALSDVGLAANEGDVVTIGGIFVDKVNGTFVEINPYTIIWTGDAWKDPNVHDLVHFPAVEPGCHYNGNVEYWFCKDCEGFWTDEACTQLTNSKSVVLPATGSDNVVHVEAKAPNCNELGNVEYWHCPDCEQFWTDEACTQLTNALSVRLPMTEHNIMHVEAIEPNCHMTGNDEHWYCSICRTYWADEARTQITNAKNVIRPALGSDNLVHVEAKDATCKEEGNIEYWHCPDCEQFWQDEALTQLTNSHNVIIGKTNDHNAVKLPEVPAQVGKTGLTEGSQCSVCETILKEQKETPALKLAAPKASKVTKATGGKKQITVKFKKVSGVTRYEIQIATKKNMKKGLKTVKVTKAKDMKNAKFVVKKLKAKTTYYVRIRTVKTVNGVTKTSKWSKVAKASKTK